MAGDNTDQTGDLVPPQSPAAKQPARAKSPAPKQSTRANSPVPPIANTVRHTMSIETPEDAAYREYLEAKGEREVQLMQQQLNTPQSAYPFRDRDGKSYMSVNRFVPLDGKLVPNDSEIAEYSGAVGRGWVVCKREDVPHDIAMSVNLDRVVILWIPTSVLRQQHEAAAKNLDSRVRQRAGGIGGVADAKEKSGYEANTVGDFMDFAGHESAPAVSFEDFNG